MPFVDMEVVTHFLSAFFWIGLALPQLQVVKESEVALLQNLDRG